MQIGKSLEMTLPDIIDDDADDQGSINEINYGGVESIASIAYP